MMPKTTQGSWSLKLSFASIVLFILIYLLSFIGNTQHIFDNKNIANIYLSLIPMFLYPSGALGILAGIAAVVSAYQYKERSWLLIIPLLLLFIIVFSLIREYL